MSDKEFADGLIVKPPHEKAPDFVKCSISIKRKDLGNWLRGKSEDWINLDVKVSQNGKWYCEVNNWKPEAKKEPNQDEFPHGGMSEDDIPFN
jgi:hypothetical protein